MILAPSCFDIFLILLSFLPFSPLFIATSLCFSLYLDFLYLSSYFSSSSFFFFLSLIAVPLLFYFKISFFVLLSFFFFQLRFSFSLSLISTFAYLSIFPTPLSFSFPSAFPPPTDIIPYLPFLPTTAESQSAHRQSGRSSNTPACGSRRICPSAASTLADDSSSRSFERPPASLFLFLPLIFLLLFSFFHSFSFLALVSPQIIRALVYSV